MIELTEQQQQAIDASPEPMRLIDPRTHKTYVLIGTETYDRIKNLLVGDTDVDMRQDALLVERVMRDDDANDPTLEFYQLKCGNKPLKRQRFDVACNKSGDNLLALLMLPLVRQV